MKKFLSKFYIVLVFAFLYLPIFVLIMFSFNETKAVSEEAKKALTRMSTS